MTLAGKIAIVTGAGSSGPGWGNGKAAAVLFARLGAAVLAVDVNASAAEETRALIAAEGNRCQAFEADVSKGTEMAEMVVACVTAFGRIDILHNNVGIYRLGGPTMLVEHEWDQVLATNLNGLFLSTRHVLPVMVSQGAGAIVNVGSVAGMRHMGLPHIAYATSKGAVMAFTRGIAAEFGRYGIRANVVVPGIIDTPLLAGAAEAAYARASGETDLAAARRAREATIPLERFGSPWDVAHASAFLLSDDASYITGTELVVDGGLTCVAPQAARAT